jgi:IclR family KDG regulon transcriptional repressor
MVNGIKSTVKSLKVLELFSPQKREWSVQDMAEMLRYHKSSIQRIVSTLEREGFLKRVQSNRGVYRLGPQVLFLGSIADMSTDLRSVARPIMAQLVKRVQETSYLCILEGNQCLYVEKVESSQPIQIIHAVGKRNPLHCTGVGKALMSGMTEQEIRKFVSAGRLKSFTPHTITKVDSLLLEIEQIRKSGVAYDLEELDLGVECVAAPIHNHAGRVVAAVSISGPAQRFTPEVLPRFEKEVRACARAVSWELGFLGPSCGEIGRDGAPPLRRLRRSNWRAVSGAGKAKGNRFLHPKN